MSRIPEPQPRISFVSAWTQLEIAQNAEMKQLHPKRLTQGSKEHLYLSEGGKARLPAFFLHFTPYILDGVQIRSSWWPANEFDIGLP
jgi:hypothetical protein